MGRKNNTTKDGKDWTEEIKKTVWEKGRTILQHDKNIWRRDICGLVINWSEFGSRNSDLGWEIDHIDPVINGGRDDLSNLQPLNWNNNADKADGLDWVCHSKGN